MNMKKGLKKYAYESPLMNVDKKCFIIDYDACGDDERLYYAIELFVNLIKKHFTITYTEILPCMVIYYYI